MIDIALKYIEENFKKAVFWLILLVITNILVFRQIAGGAAINDRLLLYFLPVGQGDSELVILPGGVKMLVDGGPPDALVLKGLDRILSPHDRYIDIVALSHEELDHFGGLIEVLKRYRVGAFVWNGIPKDTKAAADLERLIAEMKTPVVALAAGDRIKYGASAVRILWPPAGIAAGSATNETALVMKMESGGLRTLFTGDIGGKTERRILADMTDGIDVLKVGHHGSKFSSVADFLAVLRPKVAVIEVGKNSYGHPTKEVLDRLADAGARIFRTDLDGLVKMEAAGGALKIFKIQ